MGSAILPTPRARSSADRALASGARGQRFESSRAYPLLHCHAPDPFPENSEAACPHVRTDVCVSCTLMICCTYISGLDARALGIHHRSASGQSWRGTFPSVLPCRAPPPAIKAPAAPAPSSSRRFGVQEGFAWSFAGTAKSMHFKNRSAHSGIN